ncbi:hypothetical protein ACPV4Z_18320 [Vibrio aestuarianus]|uniref:hypothetical protein n=1 Tax=Vibrio aestuarianus TaxID=28171 RepID=UPI0040676D52
MNALTYLNTLKNRLAGHLNSVAFKTTLGEEKVYKFHRKGENAKTLQVPALANRSVKLTLGGVNTKPVKATS